MDKSGSIELKCRLKAAAWGLLGAINIIQLCAGCNGGNAVMSGEVSVRCTLQVLGRSAQAVARGGARCASQGCAHLLRYPGRCPRRRSLCVEGISPFRPAVARGAAQVVGRGTQAVASGGAHCASRVFDRGA
jgi:hypothetical protein